MNRRPPQAAKPAASATGSIPLGQSLLIGRSPGMVDRVLSHPTVSQRHAKVFRRGSQVLVADLRSTYGTFVDGRRVVREAPIAKGSRLTIGPFEFVFDGAALVPNAAASSELSVGCAGVRRTVTDRVTGRPLTLLHDISVAIRPREFVCLIGPSGSGKSTLLSLLSGRVKPDAGRVVYGGRDLHAEFDALKHDLAVVPQKEALHQQLTVRQSLWYAAGLRLPSDTTAREIDGIVAERLREVGLEERREVRIRDLSGGQLKRISLANEIAHRPNLLFLDEVTSGLDELGDEDLMKLFRQLADNGRSVVCITHNTLNIERNAHVVVVLTTGGRLACIGSPAEVCRYFDVARLGDVYGALAGRPPADWETRFRRHALREKYLDARLGGLANAKSAAGGGYQAVSPRRPISFARQWRMLAARVFTLQVLDIRSFGMALGQAVFVGLMLVALFGDVQDVDDGPLGFMNARNAAFLLLVSVFWLGCNNAAPEIVKERLLFERERAVSVNAVTYYVAKVCVLGFVSLSQAALVYGCLAWGCNLPAQEGVGGLFTQALTVAVVGALGTFMGLAISSQAKTEELAVRAVPLVLIPQIVLANVIATLEGPLEWVARGVVSTYWSFAAFTSGVEDYFAPGDDPGDLAPALAMLLVHCVVLVGIALLGLRPQAGSGGGIRG